MFKFIGEPVLPLLLPLDELGTIWSDCGEGTIMLGIIRLLLFMLFIDEDREGSVRPLDMFIWIQVVCIRVRVVLSYRSCMLGVCVVEKTHVYVVHCLG